MTEAEAQLMELVYKDPTGATAAYMIKEALKNPEKAHLTCDALLRAVDFSRISAASIHALLVETLPVKDKIGYRARFAEMVIHHHGPEYRIFGVINVHTFNGERPWPWMTRYSSLGWTWRWMPRP